MLEIGISLASEKNSEKLLENILKYAMEITNSDGGTLYVKEENNLLFKKMITKSLGIYKSQEEIDLPPVKINKSNVCSYSVLNNEAVNIPDVYKSTLFDFSGPKNYDALTGYKTTSMMVVPMQNNRDEIIGALQLMNATDENGNVIAFSKEFENVILSLASQVAISLTNVNYSKEITELMESIVETFSTTIYSRTQYNVTHTKNMVKYADRFIDWVNEKNVDIHYTKDEKRMFIMSVWLHDVGKLVTPIEIMNKPTRLATKLRGLLDRFEHIALHYKIEGIEKNIDNLEKIKEIDDSKEFIELVNTKAFVTDDDILRLKNLKERTYIDRQGNERKFILDDEFECLSIRKGTLTDKEREIMQEHVKVTKEILAKMKFKGEYAKIPKWASDHHEFLNGKGYPNGYTEKDIEKPTRLLTIIDVFDGLTAIDRPYKKPTPVKKVIEILNNMADEGILDRKILDLFIESKVWE